MKTNESTFFEPSTFLWVVVYVVVVVVVASVVVDDI